jgi:uncharacterized membrane protein YhiD involved in acid resistance
MAHELYAMLLRVVGALLIGALIGLERSFHGRPAGFRTHALVCLASACLTFLFGSARGAGPTAPPWGVNGDAGCCRCDRGAWLAGRLR